MRRGVALLCVFSLLVGCTTTVLEENPLTGGEMTTDRESELTADIHQQIRSQATLINDPIVLDYVYELGEKIVAATEPQPFVYRFSVIQEDTLNAFTIGGGYVYLNTEVIAQAGDVSELVGVIAHEIAHVRKRHIARRSEGQGLATLVTLASIAAVALAGGDPALLAIGQGINVSLQIKNTRQAEAEADREGIAFMVRTGYDPEGMIRFFQRILAASPRGGGEIPAYLYTHPALEERIAAARAEMERTGVPKGLQRRDERLTSIQRRLALLRSPQAGGSGLQARAQFDRALTDPLLEEARKAREAEDLDRAAALLAAARVKGPDDPRVALAQAEVAEARFDWKTARAALEHAIALDPTVPLVQYKLGMVHRELGNRSRAVFYLERAAAGFRPGSPARQRAEFEIRRISFPVLERSSLGDERDVEAVPRFARGRRVTWSGSLTRRFMNVNPTFQVRWRDPEGNVAHEENVLMSPAGGVSSSFDSRNAKPGRYSVEVRVGESLIQRRSFEITPASPGA